MGLQHAACSLLADLEQVAAEWAERGLSGDQLRACLETILADKERLAPGTPFRREPVDGAEGAVWYLEPPSAFDDDREEPSSRLMLLRRMAGMTREETAAELAVDVRDLALWEQHGVEPPEEAAVALGGLFGVAPGFLVGGDEAVA